MNIILVLFLVQCGMCQMPQFLGTLSPPMQFNRQQFSFICYPHNGLPYEKYLPQFQPQMYQMPLVNSQSVPEFAFRRNV